MGYLVVDRGFDGIVKVWGVEYVLASLASHLAISDVNGGYAKIGGFADANGAIPNEARSAKESG